MSTLSNSQFGEIRSLYESIYKKPTETVSEDNVETLSLENFSDEEIFEMYTVEILEQFVSVIEEEMTESAVISEQGGGKEFLNLMGRGISKLTGFGKGKLGLKPSGTATVGSRRREATTGVLAGGATALLGGTPLGKEILRRVKAAGSAAVDPSQTERRGMY